MAMKQKTKERAKLRQRRGAEVARAVITEAAAALFARKGYHGTTIEEVAAAAGYSPAAIYKYFRNKEDLFGRLWAATADRLKSIFVQSAAMELPFALRLRWVATMLGQLLESSPDLVVAFLAQRPHLVRSAESELERRAAEHYGEYQRQIVAFVEQGIAEGVLRQRRAEDLALLFMGLLQGFAYRWVTAPEDFDLPANTNLMIELFLRGAGDPAFEGPV
jgi:AcrR family transcriptional regulator